MKLRGPILCASDLSEAADAALRQASAIATEIGAPLTVCHVLPEAFNVRVLFPQDAGVDTSVQAQLTEKATAALRARLDGVLGAELKSVELAIETGSVHAGILAAAQRIGAGLIVLAPGEAAVRVARAADTPVLIARPFPRGGGVLAATDFSDPSLPAVRTGAAEALRRGVRFRLLHCLGIDGVAYAIDAGLPGTIAPWPLPSSVTEQLEMAAREKLTRALSGIDVVTEAVVSRSSPEAGIVAHAESEATALVVVGTRGRTGLRRLALGSVAESVIDRAPCSVLVVPLHPA